MRVIPISVPTPFYVGPVNVYLIAEEPLTIIDTGPKTKEAIQALRAGLRAAGFLVSDIRRIVLTHAHEDHCGLARAVRDEAKNAEVLVHEWETGHRHSRLEYEEHRQLLVRAGVPKDRRHVRPKGRRWPTGQIRPCISGLRGLAHDGAEALADGKACDGRPVRIADRS